MQEFEICERLWSEVLNGNKQSLYYAGKRDDIKLESSVLLKRTGDDRRVVRITKFEYKEDKNITIVHFEL